MTSSRQKQSHEGCMASNVGRQQESVKPCIIKDMRKLKRTERMTLRLTPGEIDARNALADKFGFDPSDVLRMGLRRLAEAEGIPVVETKKDRPARKG